MNEFNLLLIGDANNGYNLSFSKWMRSEFPNFKVSIISTHPIKDIIVNDNPYDQLFIVKQISGIVSKIPLIRNLCRAWNVYRLFIKYKIQPKTVLVQFVNNWQALTGRLIKRRCNNYILALWGSDFYRVASKTYLRKNLNQADNIIIGTPQMINDFKIKYPKYYQKVHLCYFGNEQIESLKEFKDSLMPKKNSCNHFKFSYEKINITIGHNGSQSHQHITIINELVHIDKQMIGKVRIILPMTYGLVPGYLEKVHKACSNLNIEYKIFTEFMSESDVAHLRNLTDIMINLQSTDAFSSSMREVLYCGGVVVNGSWLPYQFLKDRGIYFEEVNSIAELPGKLNEIIFAYGYYKEKAKNNSHKIYNLSSWSGLIEDWKKVIELKIRDNV